MEEEEATLSYLGLKVNRQEAIANSGYDKGHKTEPDGGNLQDIDNGDLQPVVAFTSWSEVTILVDSCKKSIGKIAKNTYRLSKISILKNFKFISRPNE